mmetsp:Transcript_21404/g.61958  ORF Transcript_21404/g.61958 Transcript_21404/m.61958 type:complete len:294 (+) Transcript_21404:1752-2633(+)
MVPPPAAGLDPLAGVAGGLRGGHQRGPEGLFACSSAAIDIVLADADEAPLGLANKGLCDHALPAAGDAAEQQGPDALKGVLQPLAAAHQEPALVAVAGLADGEVVPVPHQVLLHRFVKALAVAAPLGPRWGRAACSGHDPHAVVGEHRQPLWEHVVQHGLKGLCRLEVEVQQRCRLCAGVVRVHRKEPLQRVRNVEGGNVTQVHSLGDRLRHGHGHGGGRGVGDLEARLLGRRLLRHYPGPRRKDRWLGLCRFQRHRRARGLIARVLVQAPLCSTVPPPLAVDLCVAVPDGPA